MSWWDAARRVLLGMRDKQAVADPVTARDVVERLLAALPPISRDMLVRRLERTPLSIGVQNGL